MKTRRIGPFQVSALGLGCMNLSHAYGTPPSREQAAAVLKGALDAGITLFDTAALYGFGANEELVGAVLSMDRERIVLASKCGMQGVDGRRVIDGRPETLGSCAYGAVTYDSAADAVLFHFKGGEGIRIYHPATNRWSRAAPPPDVQWKYRGINGFYDPVLNVHYYHLAGDSRDNGFLLVYRCRR